MDIFMSMDSMVSLFGFLKVFLSNLTHLGRETAITRLRILCNRTT